MLNRVFNAFVGKSCHFSANVLVFGSFAPSHLKNESPPLILCSISIYACTNSKSICIRLFSTLYIFSTLLVYGERTVLGYYSEFHA